MASIPRRIGYYKLPAREFAQRLRDHGLTSPSGHYDLNRFATASDADLNRYVDRCIEGARLARPELHHLAVPRCRRSGRSSRSSASSHGSTRSASGSRRAACSSRITTTASSSPSRTAAFPTTSSCARPIPSWSSCRSISTGSSHDSKQPPRYWFERAPGRYVMWHVKDMHKVIARLHRARQRHDRLHAHLARRGVLGHEALLRGAGRQLRAGLRCRASPTAPPT